MRTNKKESRTATGGRPQKRQGNVWAELTCEILYKVSRRYPELKKEVAQKIGALERVSNLDVRDAGKIDPEDFNVLVGLWEAMDPKDFEVLGKSPMVTKEALVKLAVRIELVLLSYPVDLVSTQKRKRRKSNRLLLLTWLHLNPVFCIKRDGHETQVATPFSRFFGVMDVETARTAAVMKKPFKPTLFPKATFNETALAISEALGIDVREKDLNDLL